jgi:hypothetical protein
LSKTANKSPRRPARKKPKAPVDKTPNGVLVVRGQEGYELTPLGDVKPTELPTVLRQAANAAETALGIGGG